MKRDIEERISSWRALESRLVAEQGPGETGPGRRRESSRRGVLSRLLSRQGGPDARSRRAVSASSAILIPGTQASPFETVCLTRAPTMSTGLSVPELELRSLAGSTAAWRDPSAWSGKLLRGRYAIDGLLAAGGTSLVFLGVDRKQRRPVALKIIPPGLSAIVEESRSLTRALNHPSVLEVLDSGPAGEGGLFQALPLLEGLPLARLLGGGKVPVGALLLAFRRACEGVAHAHERGILHRDLKPSNIHVEPGAGAVVADWDLACASRAASSGGKLRFGTPLYMAPEQFRAESLGPPADVYALGLILYEILTGSHPAGQSGDIHDIAYRTLNETPPPPTFLNEDAPPSLDEVTLRALRKDPRERYATAADLLEAVEDAGAM